MFELFFNFVQFLEIAKILILFRFIFIQTSKCARALHRERKTTPRREQPVANNLKVVMVVTL
jgi:hypothetical protein